MDKVITYTRKCPLFGHKSINIEGGFTRKLTISRQEKGVREEEKRNRKM